MAVLNYKVQPKKQSDEEIVKQVAAQKDKYLKSSKQAVVNEAMMSRVPSEKPTPNPPNNVNNKGWGGVNK